MLQMDAQAGDPEAQFRLGKAMLVGAGVPQNVKIGIFWIVLADYRGHQGAARWVKMNGGVDIHRKRQKPATKPRAGGDALLAARR